MLPKHKKLPDLKRVLALSGGIDSAAILAAPDDPIDACVFVDYGQPAAKQEEYAARWLSERFDVPLAFYRVQGMALGHMADEAGAPGPRVVGARNAIIASLCSNHCVAISGGAGGFIYFGAHRDDESDYPDCRALFFDFLGAALVQAYRTHVVVPNINLSKKQVAAKLGQILTDACTWSCYAPNADGSPCGSCNSCLARAGVEL